MVLKDTPLLEVNENGTVSSLIHILRHVAVTRVRDLIIGLLAPIFVLDCVGDSPKNSGRGKVIMDDGIYLCMVPFLTSAIRRNPRQYLVRSNTITTHIPSTTDKLKSLIEVGIPAPCGDCLTCVVSDFKAKVPVFASPTKLKGVIIGQIWPQCVGQMTDAHVSVKM
eukprot:15004383-Ditylum_brightwellii.AAC.1